MLFGSAEIRRSPVVTRLVECMKHLRAFIQLAALTSAPLATLSSMARFNGQTQQDLVDHLIDRYSLKKQPVIETMLRVDRGKYAPNYYYSDHPVGIGYDATISAPHMHAWALEKLADYLVPGNRALDVGVGSGYMATAMGDMVRGKGGVCIGIDYIPELVDMSLANVMSDRPELVEEGTVQLFVADGWKGFDEYAPYDAIHVGAAATTVDRWLPSHHLIL